MLIFDWMLNGFDEDLSKKIIVKSPTMPEAGEKYNGEVYMYVGETSASYTHGYIYECVSSQSYLARATFEPHDFVFDELNHSLVDFFAEASDDYLQVVSGRFKYLQDGDIWNINGLDENGDTIFSDYQLYTQDLIDAGFTFIVPMEDISDGDEVSYEVTFHEQTNYSWERIDVQPTVIGPDGTATVDTPDGSNVDAVVNVEYVNNVVGTIETELETI